MSSKSEWTALARTLPDGRLHLHQGPIDIVAQADGPARDEAIARAQASFETVLAELVSELPQLRLPIGEVTGFRGRIAQAMHGAARPFAVDFVTPMAAVAGAVADEILGCMAGPGVTRAYANNGGDVAIHLTGQTRFVASVAAPVPARVRIDAECAVRGIATSGWRGRSHSLGIADSVTVLARTAAVADVAATLICNAVNLPGHPGIRRVPASEIAPDSDLGDRPVTRAVPHLSTAEIAEALDHGRARAEGYLQRGLIVAAYLVLQGETRILAPPGLQLTRPAS